MRAPHTSRVSRTALAWVREHRDHFALPDDVLDPRANVNLTLKPLGELAQLCASILLRGHPGGTRHRHSSELLEFAWDETRQGDLFVDLTRGEPFAPYPLEIYAAFASVGMRHDGFEELAATMVSTRSWQRAEMEPNRRLGLLNTERRGGFPQQEAPLAALGRTWLGALPEPWTFERGAGYGLTHVVFHLTDWGNEPQRMPAELGRYLETWLPAWLDSCLEDELWDLGCELLAVAASLPQPPPYEATEAAWARIASIQDEAGGLPEWGAGHRGHAPPRDFVNCYHSTLVAAFAATLADTRLDGIGDPAAENKTAENETPDSGTAESGTAESGTARQNGEAVKEGVA